MASIIHSDDSILTTRDSLRHDLNVLVKHEYRRNIYRQMAFELRISLYFPDTSMHVCKQNVRALVIRMNAKTLLISIDISRTLLTIDRCPSPSNILPYNDWQEYMANRWKNCVEHSRWDYSMHYLMAQLETASNVYIWKEMGCTVVVIPED
eukprot:832175_1